MPKFTKAQPAKAPEGPPKTVFVSRHENHILGGGPEVVKFQGGRFETTSPAVVEWLRNHPDFGVAFTVEEEPPATAPTEQPEEGEDDAGV